MGISPRGGISSLHSYSEHQVLKNMSPAVIDVEQGQGEASVR